MSRATTRKTHSDNACAYDSRCAFLGRRLKDGFTFSAEDPGRENKRETSGLGSAVGKSTGETPVGLEIGEMELLGSKGLETQEEVSSYRRSSFDS